MFERWETPLDRRNDPCWEGMVAAGCVAFGMCGMPGLECRGLVEAILNAALDAAGDHEAMEMGEIG